ncbi:MAG: 30S ribosomal protein S18 [Anaerolineaceae bacterium]|nr:30S ribosomal protein S18 [Anaerolineaceae bacterium]
MAYTTRSNSSSRDSEHRPHRQYKTRYVRKPRFCLFCSDKTLVIDYKNTTLLRKFTTEEGKIRSRHQTGTCAKHQRAVAQAIKRARHIALLPFTGGTWEEKIR